MYTYPDAVWKFDCAGDWLSSIPITTHSFPLQHSGCQFHRLEGEMQILQHFCHCCFMYPMKKVTRRICSFLKIIQYQFYIVVWCLHQKYAVQFFQASVFSTQLNQWVLLQHNFLCLQLWFECMMLQLSSTLTIIWDINSKGKDTIPRLCWEGKFSW